MKVTVNGMERDCTASTLAELWRAETADLDLAEPRGFAISLNGAVVRRAAWATTAMHAGDVIEMIRAVSGG
jgi:sulfur carrier protein